MAPDSHLSPTRAATDCMTGPGQEASPLSLSFLVGGVANAQLSGYREDGTAYARCRKCLAEAGLQNVSVSAAIVSFLRCSKHWMKPSGVGVWGEGDGEKYPETMAAGKVRALQREPKGKGQRESNSLRIP